MPTPASGPISFVDIRNNFYNLTNYDVYYWGTNDANFYNLNYYRGKRYRKNGNDNTFFSTGAIDFNAFYNSDGNCQCACSTDSSPPPPGPDPSSCFLGSTLVAMADGSFKRIDEVKVGDQLIGGFGYVNTVMSLDIPYLEDRSIYWINGKHNTTGEHRHWTTRGWASIDPVATMVEHNQWYKVFADNYGTIEMRQLVKFTKTKIYSLVVGDEFVCLDGSIERVNSIIADDSFDPKTPVYTLQMSGSHTYVVNNKIVSGWARDDDFDYENWKPIKR
jgi:hypothetical protein